MRIVNLKILMPAICYRTAVAILLIYRRVRYGYAFRKISLTQGQYAKVDPDVYEELNQYQWYAHKNKGTYYAYRAARADEKRKTKNVKMHHEVMKLQKSNFINFELEILNFELDGRQNKIIIDHINGDGRDNRKANLRLATYAQNSQNRKKVRKRCGSQYKGVAFSKKLKKWRAQICFNGVKKHLGYYEDEVGAAKAYDCAALRYHGRFAKLNFP